MAMIVTSDSTALSVISRDARTGTSTPIIPRAVADAPDARRPSRRPSRTNAATGTSTEPKKPSGSLAKIFSSSQVSFQSPRIVSVAQRMSGQFQKDIFEIRHHRSKIGDAHAVLGHALDHISDDVAALSANREPGVFTRDSHVRHRTEPLAGAIRLGRQHDGPLRTMAADELLRRVDVDNPSREDA